MAKLALGCAGLLLAIAVVAVAVASDGSDQGAIDRSLTEASTEGGGHRGETPRGASHDGPSTRLACRAASFSLGDRDGEIDFHLRCGGSGAKGTNRIHVARFSNSNPGLRSDVQAVTLHPEMTEYTSGSERGKCRVNRGIVLCVAPRTDGVKLSGQLSVPPESECTKTIGAYAVLPPRCAEACNLEFAVEYLFRGRPTGCSV